MADGQGSGENFDWHAALRRCLESTHYCALGTTGDDGPWVNPVFFSYAEDYSLLFISLAGSRHMQNIAANPAVSVAVFSTDQLPGSDVAGIQLSGHARKLPDEDVPQACREYFARAGAATAMDLDVVDPADYQGEDPHTWKFVRVVPTELCYFDTRFFGETRTAVPPAIWQHTGR